MSNKFATFMPDNRTIKKGLFTLKGPYAIQIRYYETVVAGVGPGLLLISLCVEIILLIRRGKRMAEKAV